MPGAVISTAGFDSGTATANNTSAILAGGLRGESLTPSVLLMVGGNGRDSVLPSRLLAVEAGVVRLLLALLLVGAAGADRLLPPPSVAWAAAVGIFLRAVEGALEGGAGGGAGTSITDGEGGAVDGRLVCKPGVGIGGGGGGDADTAEVDEGGTGVSLPFTGVSAC